MEIVDSVHFSILAIGPFPHCGLPPEKCRPLADRALAVMAVTARTLSQNLIRIVR